MKKILLLFFLNALAAPIFSQVGILGGWKNFNAEKWNSMSQQELVVDAYPMPGWQIGLDYWFRLKKRRIEFSPEISFANFHSEFENGSIQHRQGSFQFNTDIYLFDLASDCHCPTFSKSGNFFSKGFFVEISPSVSYLSNQLANETPVKITNHGNSFNFGGSVGTGLDLAFSDLFTITPLFRYYFYPNTGWDNKVKLANSEVTLKQVFLGLRLRFHFKEFANARYR